MKILTRKQLSIENLLQRTSEKATSRPSSKQSMHDCEFKRGEMCNTHGIVDNKIVKSGKKWVKKKDATYGFVTSKTTVYVCIAKKDESSISGTHETFYHGKIIEQPNIA